MYSFSMDIKYSKMSLDFSKDLVSRSMQQPLFTSDELPHYAYALKELFLYY